MGNGQGRWGAMFEAVSSKLVHRTRETPLTPVQPLPHKPISQRPRQRHPSRSPLQHPLRPALPRALSSVQRLHFQLHHLSQLLVRGADHYPTDQRPGNDYRTEAGLSLGTCGRVRGQLRRGGVCCRYVCGMFSLQTCRVQENSIAATC